MFLGTINIFAQPSDYSPKPKSDTTVQAQSPLAENDKQVGTAYIKTAKGGYLHWYASSEWWLVIIAFLTGAAIAYQAREMTKATKVMEKQISIPYRAYLVIGEITHSSRVEAQFPIENIGQVAARITSIEIEIIVRGTQTGQENYRRTITKAVDQLIVHGKANSFTLLVNLPKEIRDGETFVFSGTIKYRTGFDSTDTLKFVRICEGQYASWKLGWGYIDFDFGEQPHEQTRV